MRRTLLLSVFFGIAACGPDPNAVLPGMQVTSSNGGVRTASGGSVSTGSGGAKTSVGGSVGSAGGAVSSGGVSSKGGAVGSSGGTVGSSGGAVGNGGVLGAGGSSAGTGGTTSAGTGLLPVYTFGTGPEPCSPPKDFSKSTGSLGTDAVCMRTADDFTDWTCNNMDDRTVKINGVAKKCGEAPPAKQGSFYYFEISAGSTAWAGFSVFCTKTDCGPHSVPSCGSYPAWVSGGSAAACGGSLAPDTDASISPGIDGGSSSIDSATSSAIDGG